MALTRQYRVWVDAHGDNVLTHYTGNGPLAGVMAQVASFSNADYLNLVEATLVANGAPAPNSATFVSALDQARLVFGCADGTAASLVIPAPAALMFLADDETVNPVAILTLIAAATGVVVSATGSPVVSFRSGTRVLKSQSLLK